LTILVFLLSGGFKRQNLILAFPTQRVKDVENYKAKYKDIGDALCALL